MLNLTGFKTERETINDVYYFDFGDKGSFLSVMQIVELKASNEAWPYFSKCKDKALTGGLKSGSGAGDKDRHKAAMAYAAMVDVGESKACLAAARWLKLPTTSSTLDFERKVRGMLAGVSDEEGAQETKAEPPSFMGRTAYDAPLTKEITEEWLLGRSEQNSAVFDRMLDCLKGDKSDWVLAASGSRSYGLADSASDYDFIMVSKSDSKDMRYASNLLSKTTRSGSAVIFPCRIGHLCAMDDVLMPDGSLVHVDVSFPREGYKSLRILAHKTLFWTRLFDTEGGDVIKEFFMDLRAKARHSGTIDPKHGLLNMWTFMLIGLEYIMKNGVVLYDTNELLVSQVLETSLESAEAVCNVNKCLREFADELSNPNYVIGDFGLTGNHKRNESEFGSSDRPRAMRDPFSYVGDNPLRTLESWNIDNVIALLKHISVCEASTHDIKMYDLPNDFFSTSNVLTTYDLPIKENQTDESPVVTQYGSYFVSRIHKGRYYGLSRTETDSRMRCVVNSGIETDDVGLSLGPSLQMEMKFNKTVEWVLANMSCLHFCKESTSKIVDVGLCPQDTEGETELHAGDASEIEMFLHILDRQEMFKKKTKILTRKVLDGKK